MSTPPDDIDAWLDRREPLFRRSSTAEPIEPPAEIDNVVLARARAALRTERSDEGSRPAFFTLRQWVMPLGLAATLVLALAVVVRVGPDAAAPASRAMTESDAASSPASRAAETSAPGPGLEHEPEVPSANTAIRVPEARPETRAMRAREALAAPADLPAAAPAPVLRTAPPPAAPPPAPMTEAAMTDAAASSEVMAKSAAGGANANRIAELQADPERWYQKILVLRADGQTQEADREWRALKARYPEFEAPSQSRK